MAAHMLMAYYSRGADSRELFKDKKIYSDPSFETHFGKYNVLRFVMTKFKAVSVKEMEALVLEDLIPEIMEDAERLRKEQSDLEGRDFRLRKTDSLIQVL